jgi:hypothetical protein
MQVINICSYFVLFVSKKLTRRGNQITLSVFSYSGDAVYSLDWAYF